VICNAPWQSRLQTLTIQTLSFTRPALINWTWLDPPPSQSLSIASFGLFTKTQPGLSFSKDNFFPICPSFQIPFPSSQGSPYPRPIFFMAHLFHGKLSPSPSSSLSHILFPTSFSFQGHMFSPTHLFPEDHLFHGLTFSSVIVYPQKTHLLPWECLLFDPIITPNPPSPQPLSHYVKMWIIWL